MNYDGFQIESFEAGTGLWHARIRRADQEPVVIDGVLFSTLEVGFAWSDPDAAIADAKTQIDRLIAAGNAGHFKLTEKSFASLQATRKVNGGPPEETSGYGLKLTKADLASQGYMTASDPVWRRDPKTDEFQRQLPAS